MLKLYTHNSSTSIDKYIWIHLRARARCSLFAITINHHKWRVEKFFALNAGEEIFFVVVVVPLVRSIRFYRGALLSIDFILLYAATFIFGFYLISTLVVVLEINFNKSQLKFVSSIFVLLCCMVLQSIGMNSKRVSLSTCVMMVWTLSVAFSSVSLCCDGGILLRFGYNSLEGRVSARELNHFPGCRMKVYKSCVYFFYRISNNCSIENSLTTTLSNRIMMMHFNQITKF